MFARLILSLLLAAFAFPAMATGQCHDTPDSMMVGMAGMDHGAPATPRHDDKAVTAHSCIGCIPPSTLQPQGLTAPLLLPAAVRVVTIAHFDRAPGVPPATPPPRLVS